MKKVIIFVLLFLFMISFHLMDVGEVFWRNKLNCCNGFFCVDCNKMYHTGMCGMVFSFFILSLIALKKRKEKQKEEIKKLKRFKIWWHIIANWLAKKR